MINKFCSLILRIDTIYSALLAVLTSAIVTLCTLGMSQWTVLCIICFLFCIIFLIILIPISHSYSNFSQIRIRNNEDSCYGKAVEDVMKFHYRNHEEKGKRKVLCYFLGLFVTLICFLFCTYKSIGNSHFSLENRLKSIENKLDSLKVNECKVTELEMDSLKMLQTDSIRSDACSKFLPTGYGENKLIYEVGRSYEKNAEIFGMKRGEYKPYSEYKKSESNSN